LGKRKWGGGFWPNGLLLPPWFAADQRQGRLRRRRPAGLPATTAARERGKRERATRGFSSLTHLGLGHAVEAAPRGGNGGGDGLAVVARCGHAARQWRGCGGSMVRRERGRAIYSRSKVGSGEIFVAGRSPAGSTGGRPGPVAGRRDGTGRGGGRRAAIESLQARGAGVVGRRDRPAGRPAAATPWCDNSK
jgi:hypothetical protein